MRTYVIRDSMSCIANCSELNELTAVRPTHAVYSLGTRPPEIPRVWLHTHSEAADRRQVMRRHYQLPTSVATLWIDSGAYNNIIMFAISMDYVSHYTVFSTSPDLSLESC